MHIRTFDWDNVNVEHIARHSVDPTEAEMICRGSHMILRGREGRHLVYGQTEAGRYLTIILKSMGSGTVRIITARDMTHSERRLYHRRA